MERHRPRAPLLLPSQRGVLQPLLSPQRERRRLLLLFLLLRRQGVRVSVPGACEEAGRGGGGGGAELPPLGALWGPGGRGRILAGEQVIKNAGHVSVGTLVRKNFKF